VDESGRDQLSGRLNKDNLTDANWTPLGSPIAGDGGLKSVSYATSGSKRFYSVLTQ